MTYNEIKELITIKQVCELFDISHKGNKYHCPLHTDKTPSASVKSNKFHCFSCGFHGDIFDLAEAMGMDKETLAGAFGYEFKNKKLNRTELAKIRKEREEKERIKQLILFQQRKLIDCRRWFYLQTFDDDLFPIKFIDGLLERNNFPLDYDVEQMTKCLYFTWKSKLKER